MSQILAIAAGGALGAVSRFLLSGAVYSMVGRQFPWGTLVVNIAGSFAIGIAAAWFLSRTDAGLSRDMLVVGFLGSLTTFSSFSLDTVQLLQDGSPMRALLNVLVSVVLCIAACLAGILFARSVGLQ